MCSDDICCVEYTLAFVVVDLNSLPAARWIFSFAMRSSVMTVVIPTLLTHCHHQRTLCSSVMPLGFILFLLAVG